MKPPKVHVLLNLPKLEGGGFPLDSAGAGLRQSYLLSMAGYALWRSRSEYLQACSLMLMAALRSRNALGFTPRLLKSMYLGRRAGLQQPESSDLDRRLGQHAQRRLYQSKPDQSVDCSKSQKEARSSGMKISEMIPGPMQVTLLRVFKERVVRFGGSTSEISTERARQRCNRPWFGQSRQRESVTMNDPGTYGTKAAEFWHFTTGHTAIECRTKAFSRESSIVPNFLREITLVYASSTACTLGPIV